MFSKAWNRVALGASAVALSFGMAANANAQSLQAGQCLPRAEILAALKKDQQDPIIVGNRIFSQNSNSNLFTSNPQRSLGYNLEGDAPHGEPSKTICVRASYNNIRVNTMDNPVLPSWFPTIKNTNDMNISSAYTKGARVLMLADTFTVKDGTAVSGMKISVIALPTGEGSVKAISVDGISQSVAGLKNVVSTEHAKNLARAQEVTGPVAALTIK